MDDSIDIDNQDGKKRYVELRIPVTEGDRYRVGSINFEGNKVLKSEALRPLFNVKEGEYYSLKKIQKGVEASRDIYGTGGYWEFTGYPDLNPKNDGLAPVATDGNAADQTPADRLLEIVVVHDVR